MLFPSDSGRRMFGTRAGPTRRGRAGEEDGEKDVVPEEVVAGREDQVMRL